MVRKNKAAWAATVSRFAAPVGPALWFPLVFGAALVLTVGSAVAQDAVSVRMASAPMNILVPGMDTSPRDVIGWPVYGPALEHIGHVESVYADTSGKIAGAVITLKAEKGEPAKPVSVPRRDFVVHIGKFTVSTSGASLRDLPAYEYASDKERGTVLPAGSRMQAAKPSATQPVPATVAVAPEFSGASLIGAPVRNLADEAIGSVADLVMDGTGQLQAILVSLDNGPGGRFVRLESHEVRVIREEGGATVVTGLARGVVASRDMQQQASIR